MTGSDAATARAWHELADVLDDEKRAVDAWMIGELAPRPGQRMLEVACGTAGAGLAVAKALAPSGSVLCTDISEAMLAAARRVAVARGIANVEFRRLDAQALDLADGSVDGVVARLGLMVMPDPRAALAEAMRVLRPGGRIALSVWSSRSANPWRAIPEAVLFGAPPRGEDEATRPGPFALADVARLERLLRATGFAQPRFAEIRADHRYAGPDECWDACLRKSRSVRQAYERLDAGGRDAARREILDRLGEHVVAGTEYVVPATMLLASGLKDAAAATPRGAPGSRP
jgi:SAM-dependent methyltransferase